MRNPRNFVLTPHRCSKWYGPYYYRLYRLGSISYCCKAIVISLLPPKVPTEHSWKIHTCSDNLESTHGKILGRLTHLYCYNKPLLSLLSSCEFEGKKAFIDLFLPYCVTPFHKFLILFLAKHQYVGQLQKKRNSPPRTPMLAYLRKKIPR